MSFFSLVGMEFKKIRRSKIIWVLSTVIRSWAEDMEVERRGS